MMRNVVFFGETGGGKSSAVNNLIGEKLAKVSDSAVGCTFKFSKYPTDKYTLFDTVGLGEGNMGTVKQTQAVRDLVKLLRSLEEGVSMLVFVLEKGRINKTLDENYKLFVDVICMKKVPVILLITHCEMENGVGTWWKENKKFFDQYGMKFAAVISGSCGDPENFPPKIQDDIRQLNQVTRWNLHSAIIRHMLIPGWKVEGGWRSWSLHVLSDVLYFFKKLGEGVLSAVTLGAYTPKQTPPTFFGLRERLYNYFVKSGYPEDMARQSSKDIALIFEAESL